MGPHRDAKPLQADCFFFLEHVFRVVFFCVKWCFHRRNVEILLEILQPSGSYFLVFLFAGLHRSNVWRSFHQHLIELFI